MSKSPEIRSIYIVRNYHVYKIHGQLQNYMEKNNFLNICLEGRRNKHNLIVSLFVCFCSLFGNLRKHSSFIFTGEFSSPS